jgi:hypothetical protein
MLSRLALAATTAMLISATAHAQSIYTSSSAFDAAAAASGTVSETTSFGVPYTDGNGVPTVVSGVTLIDGNTVGVNANEVAKSGDGFAAFTNGYTGDVLYNTTASETITFASSLSALGFDIAPDLGLAAELGLPNNASITVTLSNGQSQTYSIDSFDAGDSVFFGVTGLGGIDSLTISVSGVDGFGNAVSAFAFGDIFDVPEPMSLVMLGSGVLALGLARRRARG